MQRRWRAYRTPSGRNPVGEFIRDLPDEDAEEVLAAMKDVRLNGPSAGRHLRGSIWEVRADAPGGAFRILFSQEGKRSQVLLALVPLAKKTQKTPDEAIRLAERRLSDWHTRGRHHGP